MGLWSKKPDDELDELRLELESQKGQLDHREKRVADREKLVDARENEVAAREKELLDQDVRTAKQRAEAKAAFAAELRKEFEAFFDARSQELNALEASVAEKVRALVVQRAEVERLDGAVAERERAIAEREARADAGFADRNRTLLSEVALRETACRRLEEHLAEREKALDVRDAELTRRDQAGADQLRHLREAELNAEANYVAQNRTALAALEVQRAGIMSELESLTSRESELRDTARELEATLARQANEARTSLDAEIAATRKDRLRAVEDLARSEGEARRQEQRETLRLEREAANQTLATERTRVTNELEACRQSLAGRALQLDTREAQVAQLEDQLRIDRAVFDGRVRNHEASLREQIEDATADAVRRAERAERELESTRAEANNYWKRLEELENRLARFGEDPEAVLREVTEQADRIRRLREELAQRPTHQARAELEALRLEQTTWHTDRETLTVENARLRAAESKWVTGVAELQNLATERDVAKRHADAMKGLVEGLRADVERLRALYEKPQEIEKRKAPILRPHLPRGAAGAAPPDERTWLDQVRQGCERSGFGFPRRLLTAFHTAVKTAEWSPLTVLAGVSGTGKSKLPELYARFGGLNYLLLSVQPNWDSPQSLFGFFNTVDNEFNATPLVRALDQSRRAPADGAGLEDQLLLVLLDEMNLAHVELYFSDLLSKLEDRRGKKAGVPLEIDLGGGVTHPIELRRNVLWVGTMNEDETTKTLSDKVLDRGNTLVFPRPRRLLRRDRADLAPESPKLPWSVWAGWARGSDFKAEEIDPYKGVLEQMNGHLERAGRALGHRVWQSVEHYMANHPDVLSARAGADPGAAKAAMDAAFGDQLVQKVMPKLRGIETSGKAKLNCLDPIRELVRAYGLEDDFGIACDSGYGGFVWRSAHYLEAGQ